MSSQWFDPGREGEPFDATVRFTARRIGAGAREVVVRDETLEGIVPGSGPITITSWMDNVGEGEWGVAAEMVGTGSSGPSRWRAARAMPLQPAAWSWRRWAVTTAPISQVHSRSSLLAPLAGQPAVLPGVYTLLAVIGITGAIALQVAIAASRGMPVDAVLLASLVALAAGLASAKAWYAVLHPGDSIITGGWAVDGFLVAAPIVAASLLFLEHVSIGAVLDLSAPGMFFAVAVGRVGCFLAGCCAGRLTSGRLGVWSSDRRIGGRRTPTQLIEAASGLALGLVTLPVVLSGPGPVPGLLFVLAFGTYAAIRQVLLRLRAERRRSARSIPATAAAAAGAILVVVSLTVVHGPF